MDFKNETIVETKSCQKCQTSFDITDKDLEFYDKISPVFPSPQTSLSGKKEFKKYSIPTPKLCPECRQQRRLSWRNERHLYKRKCDGTGEDIVSTFHSDNPMIVYKQDFWWSDNWSGFDYGRDFDFDTSFFEQFNELMLHVPVINILNDNNIASLNCDYSFDCWYSKNCYFVTCAWRIEDSMYCDLGLAEMKDCMDCTWPMREASACYQCSFGKNLSHCFYVENSVSTHHCTLWFNLDGCSYCYGCTDLVNKQYYIFNKPYSKHEYEVMMQNRNFENDKQKFTSMKQDYNI